MGSEIRLSQLIAPFGPGSIYTDKNGVPTVICGLDHWYKNQRENGSFEESPQAVGTNTLYEPRIAELLRVNHFRQPPAYINDDNNPGLSKLKIPGHRFPRWYVNNTNGELKRLNLETIRTPKDGFWKPVRFIAVCSAGHMSDFPWKTWAGCTCSNDEGLALNDSGGVDLASVSVRCRNCNKGKSLAGATFFDRENNETGLSRTGISCCGERPWLGNDAAEGGCVHSLAAVLINQSNIYFARTMASIFLPDLVSGSVIHDIQKSFANDESELYLADVAFKLGKADRCLKELKEIIAPYFEEVPSDTKIWKAYKSYGRGEIPGDAAAPAVRDTELLAFRRAEFNILRNEVPEGTSTELRIISAGIPDGIKRFVDRVRLVERLRETRVFYGFDRLERPSDPLEEMPSRAMRQLFLRPPQKELLQWLPAIKNYGEGIYLELSETAIQQWLQVNSDWLQQRYDIGFILRMANEPLLLPPAANIDWQWAARYQLLHSLAHLLINQLVFECGYSSAALKERLFVSSDLAAPMAGILIYTASGDSEGSMGGLVRLGHPGLFEPVVRRAISRASWCSADPVCSENLGGSGSRLVNKAACHACTLLPETACETINNGLDRAAVVGTPENQEVGFLSELLAGYQI